MALSTVKRPLKQSQWLSDAAKGRKYRRQFVCTECCRNGSSSTRSPSQVQDDNARVGRTGPRGMSWSASGHRFITAYTRVVRRWQSTASIDLEDQLFDRTPLQDALDTPVVDHRDQQDESGSATTAAKPRRSSISFTSSSPPILLREQEPLSEAGIRLSEAIERADIDHVRTAFAAVSAGDIAALSDSVFSRMLQTLVAQELVEQTFKNHELMRATDRRNLRITSAKDIFQQILDNVLRAARTRRNAGRKLNVDHYGHLLRAAYSTGSPRYATLLWRWMQDDNVRPDTNCYNAYLGAHVWKEISPAERIAARATEFNLLAREVARPGKPYNKYRAGFEGIKDITTAHLSKMLQEGVPINEETISFVMVGHAREGDLRGIKGLLLRIYGIRLADLQSGTSKPSSAQHNFEGPTRPGPMLLEAVAMSFCMLSDISTALMVIGYFATHAHIQVTEKVWNILIEWAYFLSTDHKQPSDLPASSVVKIFETMQQPPYNVKPALSHYHYLIRALDHGQQIKQLGPAIQGAYSAWQSLCQQRQICLRALNAHLAVSQDTDLPAKEERVTLSRSLIDLGLQASHGSLLLRHLVKICLKSSKHSAKRPRASEEFSQRIVPALADGALREHMPTIMQYYTPTGHVELDRLDGPGAQKGNLKADRHKRIAKRRDIYRSALSDADIDAGVDWAYPAYSHKSMKRGIGDDVQISM